MKSLLSGIVILCTVVSVYAQGDVVSAVQVGDRIDVVIGKHFFTSYRFYEDEKYPFFFPVNGPVSGSGLTSMRNGIWPHHSSLFFGCDRLNGGNYWQDRLDRGRIVSLGARIIEAKGSRVVIEDECIWKRPDAPSPVIDRRKITISAPSANLYQLDFEIEMEMLMDVSILKSGHSLFAARVDPDLSVVQGGTLVNAEGKLSEQGTFGVPSPWIDYYGTRKTGIEGLALMQHPSNLWFPSPWFTRDYGFISPTPIYFPKDDVGTYFKKGDKVKLRYRVLLHGGTTQEAGIARLFDQYKNE